MIRPKKRKHCMREGKRLLARTSANHEWTWISCTTRWSGGRAIRMLSVIDAYTLECLAGEVDTSFASRRVARVLDAIIAVRGMAGAIRCDNGPISPTGTFWRGRRSGRSSCSTFSRVS